MLNNIVTLKSSLDVTQGHLKLVPFESLGKVSYSHSVVTTAISFLSYSKMLVKNCNVSYPSCIQCPSQRGPRWNIAIMFGMEKLDWCAYLTVKRVLRMFSHFDRILACDRQTDRHLATAQCMLCMHRAVKIKQMDVILYLQGLHIVMASGTKNPVSQNTHIHLNTRTREAYQQ